ncbi:putative transcriptional regulator [Caldisphaera lagunensis DSM 15908]|uniref:Putative transcriptional regulator n=1 Tax=Caldisphaera lagunensis (strain DSM 15908 / JCM 11604 / ANMR 0165 / IC-154) TaxID=1056495 RepID=L0ACS5_CALLD|nr:helix-turn-helix domain-containing protein [Caldisphaera lagunensis]AFZ70947.1 putative transcriptional regulator [Caldisphaera lagunensis DSM 15908]
MSQDKCELTQNLWEKLAKKWTLAVVYNLGKSNGSGFNELKNNIGNISPSSLVERLTELESMGIIKREVIPNKPPRVLYKLTKKGEELYNILDQLVSWYLKNSEVIIGNKEIA